MGSLRLVPAGRRQKIQVNCSNVIPVLESKKTNGLFSTHRDHSTLTQYNGSAGAETDSENINDGVEVREPEAEGTKEQNKQPSKQNCNWSPADILQLSEDLLYKLAEQRSLKDPGGVNQLHMVRMGLIFMERALGIPATKAPFLIDKRGNCLPNTLAYIANPNQNEEETIESGADLRNVVMVEALEVVRRSTSETLRLIQAAAAPSSKNLGDKDESLTKQQLLEKLGRYRRDGVWAGELGDLMPQIYSSFTHTPLFVIVHNSNTNQLIGYFINPYNVFNQPTYDHAARVIIWHKNHFEPLQIPEAFRMSWEAVYENFLTQDLGMAAIQLTLTEDDLEDIVGQGRDENGPNPNTTGDGEYEQRQQKQDDEGSCAGY